MAKQAWERFDESYIGLDQEPAPSSPSIYITTLWEGGIPTGVVATDEACAALHVLEPADWHERMAMQYNED